MSSAARGWGWSIAAGLLGAGLLVLMSRSVLDHAVHYDELLHILAARGLLQTGLPAIADGFYVRAELFTRAVAWSFSHFGDSLRSARLPALFAGAALAFLLGAWMTRKAGALAGAAAAVFLCVVPTTVDVAVFARFYTIHAVLMTLMFIAAYEATRPGRSAAMRAVAVLVVLAIALLGWHFQETTIIAVGAVAAAVAALMVNDHWDEVRAVVVRRPVLMLVTLTVSAVGALVSVWYLGLLDQLGNSPLWAAGNARRYQYYLVEFRDDMPLLWPLLPVAATLAVAMPAHRRLGLFCLVAVGSALLVHSIAAQKSLRYVYYLAPLMSMLWAIALANVIGLAQESDAARIRGPQRSAFIVWALVGAGFVLAQEGARTLNLLAGRVENLENRPFASEPEWSPLVVELEPRARAADYVVTSNSMKAIYYLGRYDYELNATIVPETETRAEFGRDRRTGRQAIGTAESIRQVLDQPGQTLVVIEESKIGRFSGVSSEAFAVIETRCNELSLPADTSVRAWWCERSLQTPGVEPLNTR